MIDTCTTQPMTLRRWLATAGQHGRRLTTAELARRLGYSPEHLYRMLSAHALTYSFRGRFYEEFPDAPRELFEASAPAGTAAPEEIGDAG